MYFDNDLLVVGDVHGKFKAFKNIVKANLHIPIIQVGDMGIGFAHEHPLETNFRHAKFIRGNHDNPEPSRQHPNYLGEYGYDANLGVFYVSGAESPWWWKSKHVIGYDWWEDEELSQSQLTAAIDFYGDIKPSIMITHDCPMSIYDELKLINGDLYMNRTTVSLETMFNVHQPEIWLFGHHHKSRQKKIGNTLFVCLDELEEYLI